MTAHNGPRTVFAFDERSQTVTITIPMQFHRRPGRKVILAPEGAAYFAPPSMKVDRTLVKALARAHRWKRLLEAGECYSAHELAAAEGITHSFVCRLLKLTLLAPDIVQAILDGTLRRDVQLTDLLKPLPCGWLEQREILNQSDGAN